jgi:hypothetical protein
MMKTGGKKMQTETKAREGSPIQLRQAIGGKSAFIDSEPQERNVCPRCGGAVRSGSHNPRGEDYYRCTQWGTRQIPYLPGTATAIAMNDDVRAREIRNGPQIEQKTRGFA